SKKAELYILWHLISKLHDPVRGHFLSIHSIPLKFNFKCLSMQTAELQIYLDSFRETQEMPRADETEPLDVLQNSISKCPLPNSANLILLPEGKSWEIKILRELKIPTSAQTKREHASNEVQGVPDKEQFAGDL
uniref:Uncharacterized protein n=1 Tax=Strigops habroptila TaxID=2489341 RepID=A0A672UQM4_STRHB